MRRDLDALTSREHDLVVVGGGIHGAAAAWDAAQRGLAVALVERTDFGSGASWNSLKTIHGGLRHLQRADLAGLRESSRERRALLSIAPELVRPLGFLIPTHGHGIHGREALAAALLANDLLTLDRNRGLRSDRRLPRGRVLSAAEVRAAVPLLAGEGINGGALWHDAQVASSERLLVAFLQAASQVGAVLANYVEVIALVRSAGRVVGVAAHDTETGRQIEVRAPLVLNAAGAAAGTIAHMAGIERELAPLMQAVNLVLGRALVADLAVGGEADGRYLFLVPWNGRSIVGTDYGAARTEEPGGTTDLQVQAFLDRARRAFPWAKLREEDLTLVHRGQVPGHSEKELLTRHRVLDHQTRDGVAGLVSILSAKYTTARVAAEEAIDLALRKLGRPRVRCRTARTPLPGAAQPQGPLAQRARLAVREEMALHLEDAVLRRLDLGTAGPPPPAAVAEVLAAMAEELGWDEARRQGELQSLSRGVARRSPAA